MKVIIWGYGILGKSLINICLKQKNKYDIVAVVSKRAKDIQNELTKYGLHAIFPTQITEYKFDIILLCSGSANETYELAKNLSQKFCFVDSYDNHAIIENYKKDIGEICLQSQTTTVSFLGWDPGLFSLIRAIFYEICNNEPQTQWGKGISQGHSNAVKKIEGINNAISLTIPNKKAFIMAKKRNMPQTKLHIRKVYVVKKYGYSKKNLVPQIRQIPNYFFGYRTIIKFLSQKSFEKRFKDICFHQGKIFGRKSNEFELKFSVKMKSNPDFTAQIMLLGANACYKLFQSNIFGCFSILDIPPKNLCSNDIIKFI